MFYCQWCDKKFHKHEANVRTESNVFTAPYGDTFVNGGGVFQVETCPYCGEDMEEVVE